MTDNTPLMKAFYALAGLLILAVGLLYLFAPQYLVKETDPSTALAALGLLLAAAINGVIAFVPSPRKILHALVGLYLIAFLALACQGQGLWIGGAAIVLYLLPLIPLPAKLPLPIPGSNGQQKGQVKWFNARKGYGFIVTDNGDEIFVHFRALKNGGRQSLRPGVKVSFQVRDSERGEQADQVYIEDN